MRFGRIGAALVVLVVATLTLVVPAAPASAKGCSTGASQSCAPKTGGSGPSAMVGRVAPSTVGPDLTGSGTLDLAATDGTPTAVVFWLNTCPHCQEALPEIDRLAQRVVPKGRIVTGAIDIGAAGGPGFETPAAAVDTLGVTMPTALVTRELADQWKVESTPTAFIVDADGRIRRAIVTTDTTQLVRAIRTGLRQAG